MSSIIKLFEPNRLIKFDQIRLPNSSIINVGYSVH